MKSVLVLGLMVVGILALRIVPAQQLTPCGRDPGWNPRCLATRGQCSPMRFCQINAGYGPVLTHCCYEDANGRCVQIEGRWECCYIGENTYGWKVYCKEISREASQLCMNEHKCH